MPITRINDFRAAPGKAHDLRAFLQGVVNAIKSAPGFVSCELLASHDDDHAFVILERWDNIAAHQAAATHIPPEEIAKVRALIAEPPRGVYYTPDAH